MQGSFWSSLCTPQLSTLIAKCNVGTWVISLCHDPNKDLVWCVDGWSSLPKYEASHEFQTKKKRQQQRQQQEEAAKRQKTMNHPPCHVHVSSLPALPLHHVPAHATHNTGLSPHVTIPVNQHYRVGNISRGGNPGHHPTGVRAHYGGPGQVVGYGPNHGQAITVYGGPPPLPQPAGYSAPGIMQVGRGGYGAGYTSTLVYGGIGGQGPAISVHGQQFGYIYPALSGIIALDVRCEGSLFWHFPHLGVHIAHFTALHIWKNPFSKLAICHKFLPMLKLTPVNLVQQSSESNFAACIFCSATLHASGNFQTASFQVFPVSLRLSLSISFFGCYKWSNVWARSPLLLVWIAC